MLDTGIGKHATLFVGVIDHRDHTLHYSLGAQLPEPLLVAEGDELAEGSPVAKIEVSEDTAPRESEEARTADAGERSAAATEEESADTRQRGERDEDGDGEAATAGHEAADGEPATAGHEAADGEAATAGHEAADEHREPAPRAPDDEDTGRTYAGPAVRRMARELGAPLAEVAGSGPHGRILKEDLQAYVRQRLDRPAPAAGGGLPVVPEVDFSRFGPVEVAERSKLDKLTAANMQRSWLNVPHVTQFDDADITELEAFRAQFEAEAQARGSKLSPLPFVLKACAVALRDNPRLNSSLAEGGEKLVLRQYCHIGMAVDTPAGLLVPVLRDVDRKSLWEIADEVMSLAARARERKLKPDEMQGASFTVSSLGGIGGRGFTPIINTPEVGILGVSRAQLRPVWRDGQFAPRTLLPLALSYDHRVVNGGDGGRFLTRLVELLGDIRRLLM